MHLAKLVAIVSVYNSGRWLEHRIRNLINTTTYKRKELLIFLVDANSPDPRDQEIGKYFGQLPNICYRRIRYCTIYGAWNYALSQTRSMFVTNANSDDLVAPDCYDRLIAVLEEKRAPLVYPAWYEVTIDNLPWEEATKVGHKVFIGPPALNFINQIACGHFPLWRRSLHKKVGYFDPSFHGAGDADFWMRCWINKIRDFEYIPECLGAYLWRRGQNLWFSMPIPQRDREWHVINNRKPGKILWTPFPNP